MIGEPTTSLGPGSAAQGRLRERIWREVLAHDLLPTQRELDRGIVALSQRGRALLRDELEPRLGARLPGLYGSAAAAQTRAGLGRVAAFWHQAAEAAARCLGQAPHPRAGVASACFALATTALDQALDQGRGGSRSGSAGRPALDPAACALHLSPAALAAAWPADPGGPALALDGPAVPGLLVPCLAGLDLLFTEARALHQAAPDGVRAAGLRAALLECLGDALAAELSTTQLLVEAPAAASGDAGDAMEVLRAANTLPLWVVYYLALLTAPAPGEAVERDLLLAIADLAEVAWLLDDLADCAEDLQAGRWNRVLLALRDEQPGVVEQLLGAPGAAGAAPSGVDRVLQRLGDSQVIGAQVGLVEAALHRLGTLSALAEEGVADMRGLCRLLTWSWLVPDVGVRAA